MLRHIIKMLRPDQWTKNLVLFAGLLFAGGLGTRTLVLHATGGFLTFCALSGATYVFNDLMDVKRDREHPVKKLRPLAAGDLPLGLAAGIAIVLAVLGLVWAYKLHQNFGLLATGYLTLQLLYSLALRKMVVLDVMAIAVGFVLRAVGSVEVLKGPAPATELSPWLLVCTFFLALFLGLGKRRHEVLLLREEAGRHRAVLEHYPPQLIDALLGVVTAATVVSYAIYTIWPGTVAKVGGTGLVYTVPFVVYGVFRYLYLMFATGGGGQPSRALLSDLPLAVNIILWVLVVAFVIYGG
ncbi:MAG: decaprenyl-phosphate phosphoribosyltransferase [Candidatus Eisenbacteria sp.]|nr:decaprenyl-phosphate phosphoribosyltransferase [Candidatus Eisenbacteria bacterium]